MPYFVGSCRFSDTLYLGNFYKLNRAYLKMAKNGPAHIFWAYLLHNTLNNLIKFGHKKLQVFYIYEESCYNLIAKTRILRIRILYVLYKDVFKMWKEVNNTLQNCFHCSMHLLVTYFYWFSLNNNQYFALSIR